MTDVPVVGCFAPDGLALPATQLIEDGRASAPMGVFPTMREQGRNLMPPVRRLCPLQLKGLGNRLTGNRELQGEAPGVQRGLGAWGARLLRTGVHVVGMREQGGEGRGDERGMPEGLQRPWLLGVDGVQSVDRLIQPEAEFPLPPHPVEVGDLPRPHPWGPMGEEKPIALRRLDADQARIDPCCPAPHMHICIKSTAIQDQRVVLQEGIQVSPREEGLGRDSRPWASSCLAAASQSVRRR